MTKNPSAHRTSDLTTLRVGRMNMKLQNIHRLLDEISELERKLKNHPSGSIVYKAQIKEKRTKLKQLDPEKKISLSFGHVQINNRQKWGILGLSVTGLSNLGKELSLSKVIDEYETVKSTKYRSFKRKRFPR